MREAGCYGACGFARLTAGCCKECCCWSRALGGMQVCGAGGGAVLGYCLGCGAGDVVGAIFRDCWRVLGGHADWGGGASADLGCCLRCCWLRGRLFPRQLKTSIVGAAFLRCW